MTSNIEVAVTNRDVFEFYSVTINSTTVAAQGSLYVNLSNGLPQGYRPVAVALEYTAGNNSILVGSPSYRIEQNSVWSMRIFNINSSSITLAGTVRVMAVKSADVDPDD